MSTHVMPDAFYIADDGENDCDCGHGDNDDEDDGVDETVNIMVTLSSIVHSMLPFLPPLVVAVDQTLFTILPTQPDMRAGHFY